MLTNSTPEMKLHFFIDFWLAFFAKVHVEYWQCLFSWRKTFFQKGNAAVIDFFYLCVHCSVSTSQQQTWWKMSNLLYKDVHHQTVNATVVNRAYLRHQSNLHRNHHIFMWHRQVSALFYKLFLNTSFLTINFTKSTVVVS